MNPPNSLVTVSICASDISLRLEPKDLRILRHMEEASINWTLPRRASGFRLLMIQT